MGWAKGAAAAGRPKLPKLRCAKKQKKKQKKKKAISIRSRRKANSNLPARGSRASLRNFGRPAAAAPFAHSMI